MSFEAYFKKISDDLNRYIIKFKGKYPETKNNQYPEELIKIFEKYIELYGHAYCMDVRSERRKLSKLLFRALNEIKN